MEGGCVCLRARKSIISRRKSQTQKGQLIEETYSYLCIVCNPYSISTRKNDNNIFHWMNKKMKNQKEKKRVRQRSVQGCPPHNFSQFDLFIKYTTLIYVNTCEAECVRWYSFMSYSEIIKRGVREIREFCLTQPKTLLFWYKENNPTLPKWFV